MKKKKIRCLAKIKVRGKWQQCTHEISHGGRHTYYTKKGGYRFFTEKQARYWPMSVMKVKRVKAEKLRRMYEREPTPITGHLELKLPHVYGGYFVDPRDGSDTGDGSPARPLKTNEAAKLLYLKHGVRRDLVTQESPALREATKTLVDAASNVIRVPVKYDYAAIHPEFLKMLAEIGSYADNKYGSWAQYLSARLTGNASPVNHIYEHLRSFQMLERYDHFEGDVRRHLAAIAYNALMEFVAYTKWGPLQSPFAKGVDMRPWPPPAPSGTFEEIVEQANEEAARVRAPAKRKSRR